MAPLVIKVGSSLCLVLGIFLGLLWLQKRFPAATPKSVPPEVIEVLGTFSLATRHDTCVLRFGNKVLAVRVQGGKAEKLAEIDEPSEVQRITNCCRHPAHDSGDTLREPTLELLAHQLASQRRSR